MNRKLRMALVGGAGAGFIGRVHAAAATLDGRAELAAGALSSDPQRAKAAGPQFGLKSDQAYGSWRELIDAHRDAPPERRIDFVSIATPNFTHFEIARAALEAGFHVVCDKPLTTSSREASQLVQLVEQTGLVLTLMHNYSGYPLVRQAREMIRGGELGRIEAVRVHYIQGGRRGWTPGQRPPRGAWKDDPQQAGPAGTMADIGTHAYHLLRYVTGFVPRQLRCTLRTFFPGGRLDDYGHVLIRGRQDELAAITVSQVTHGRLNDLTLEVDGDRASLVWRQEEPERLVLRRHGEPVRVYERNPRAAYQADAARAASRIPGGHPEGFLEAFANVYQAAFDRMADHAAGRPARRETVDPNVYDGLEGVAFVETCVASHQADAAWMRFSP